MGVALENLAVELPTTTPVLSPASDTTVPLIVVATPPELKVIPNSGTTTLPPCLVAVYTLPPIVTKAVGAGVAAGVYIPGIFENATVEVTPLLGSIMTTPVPLGAWDRTMPLESVTGEPPTENIVPPMSTLVAVGAPLWPSPIIAVAVMRSPLGMVSTAPAEGVGAPAPMGWGTLMVEGAAAPGVEMTMWPGSRMETVVPGPRVMAGPPALRVLEPMLMTDGLVGLSTIGALPMLPMVVGSGTEGACVTPG